MSQQDAIDAMTGVGGIFFGILTNNLFDQAQPIADATGGQLFDLRNEFLPDPESFMNKLIDICYWTSCIDLTADDGLDLNAGECIPANSTEIVYTISYNNTCTLGMDDVQIGHTGGTWNWDVGSVESGTSGSTTMAVPLTGALTPGATFSNQFELTSSSMEGTVKVTEETLVCTNQPPVAQCKDVQAVLNADGSIIISPSDVDNGSFDPDFDPITLSLSKTHFGCSDVGVQYFVTLTVTDDGGLSSSCVANVTVADNTAPDVKTKDITVQLDSNGNASITADAVDNGTSDACGIASLSVDPSSFTCSDLGTKSVTLTATDVNNNIGSAMATVTVEDTLPPSIDLNAPATIIPPDAPISFTATAKDNCSVAELTITDYFCYRIKKNGSQQSKMESCVVSLAGDTITITDSGGVDDNIVWTILATDQSGNTTTEEGHVLVTNPGGKK